jgi:hypothetical protein
MEEGVYGLIRKGFKGRGSYWGGETGGVTAEVFGRERKEGGVGEDNADRWVPLCSEREKGKSWAGSSRAGSAGLGPGHGPRWALASFLLLFFVRFLFPFSVFLFSLYLLHFASKQGQTNF